MDLIAPAARHAAVIRTRAARADATLRAHRDLLTRHGVDVSLSTAGIARTAATIIADGGPAYAASSPIYNVAVGIASVSDRLTGTRVHGRLGGGSVIVTSSRHSPDGDNLLRIANRLLLDILGDRDDDPLFDVR